MWWRNLAVGCLTILSLSVWGSEACSCLPAHPQTLVCQSDFVMVAKILRKTNVPGSGFGGEIEYKVKVIESLKGPTPSRLRVNIRTSDQSAACGVTGLVVGEKYVLGGSMGPGYRIGLCGLVRTWSTLSEAEKNLYRNKYPNNCDCEVKICSSWDLSEPDCSAFASQDQERATINGKCVCRNVGCGGFCQEAACTWCE